MSKEGTVLYAFSKKDVELIIESVIDKVRKTEMIGGSSKTPEEDRLTQQEACELLGISVQTLIKWKREKKIPYYQLGRTVFFSKMELLKIARSNPKLVKSPRD